MSQSLFIQEVFLLKFSRTRLEFRCFVAIPFYSGSISTDIEYYRKEQWDEKVAIPFYSGSISTKTLIIIFWKIMQVAIPFYSGSISTRN